MFKLIAIDMDGTLLRSDHTVSQYTKDILKKFSDNGDNNDLPLKIHYVNTSDELTNFDNLFKIMFVANEDKIDEIIPLVPSQYIDNYNAIHSLPKIFEFLNKDCGKGFAIANLCKILNIDINDVVSFGDAPNDVDMIKMCGTGVAMGNAYDEIKEIANFVTKNNDEDGVAYFLEQYLKHSLS